MSDNVSMANERTLTDYRVPRGDILLMNPAGFDGQKNIPFNQEMVLQFKNQRMEDDLERGIPEAMVQLSESIDRFEAAMVHS